MPVPDAAARKEARRARLTLIGRAVEEHRSALGVSQAALAEKAGVGYNTVALLERGQTMPWAANRRKIENALEWDSGRLTAMYEDGADAPPLPGSTKGDSAGTGSPVELRVVQDAGNTPPSSGAPALQRWVLDIAVSATLMTATCVDVLVRHAEEDPEAMAAIEELNRRTQGLESAVAASLGEAYKDSADTFDQLLGVLNELGRTRQHIRDVGLAGT
ncbi:helix-turn-helix transcriptional regulator [Mycobacteroides abscessus subsp. abscessus]|uniref:helix-turn-helix domain-containing protein n=1 Tax=Mycobacteroides abscessus TaxID=36809 RepID=UPI00030D83D1|nr:helix-turn-helix transcriptional regulator [Mycobacteroides abscessus]MDO3101043.1 helix-turn-helix transcriptional regulator [Mycobacteroides abscessus subsp. abscessus]MDO3185005.1 helix-turn-helix transcriptional regulator [Mycobacteroides abscessus subsp. abscessus]MDO3194372.1 helix-turn-helix transcriptional regulator [Mycobacteroides abscessus subsp. abscessus]MDO3287636.1 helix-turn-helix transcriptional regulator [Mycobacteroides abscessus subsp. abscessus]SHR26136.1 putative trans